MAVSGSISGVKSGEGSQNCAMCNAKRDITSRGMQDRIEDAQTPEMHAWVGPAVSGSHPLEISACPPYRRPYQISEQAPRSIPCRHGTVSPHCYCGDGLDGRARNMLRSFAICDRYQYVLDRIIKNIDWRAIEKFAWFTVVSNEIASTALHLVSLHSVLLLLRPSTDILNTIPTQYSRPTKRPMYTSQNPKSACSK
jgi:hypothetical protein